MFLKPQDIVILLKITLGGAKDWTYGSLAHDLGMSASEVHAAIRRAEHAKLFDANTRRPIRAALLEFIIHGLKYAFAPEWGGVTRGIPTSYAVPPLSNELVFDKELPPVWPAADGTARGESLKPLYKSVPDAARKDEKLYECLALIDALRAGRARERQLAATHLRERLSR